MESRGEAGRVGAQVAKEWIKLVIKLFAVSK